MANKVERFTCGDHNHQVVKINNKTVIHNNYGGKENVGNLLRALANADVIKLTETTLSRDDFEREFS